MEFFDVIRKRRSVRYFTDDPVSEDALMEMLEAARLAPSPRNEQPWHFIVIRDQQMITNLKDMMNALLDEQIQIADTKARKRLLKGKRFGLVNVFDAPVVVVVDTLLRDFPCVRAGSISGCLPLRRIFHSEAGENAAYP